MKTNEIIVAFCSGLVAVITLASFLRTVIRDGLRELSRQNDVLFKKVDDIKDTMNKVQQNTVTHELCREHRNTCVQRIKELLTK